MIRQSLLESWRRNFCEKQLKNGAWDLGGVPPSSPRGRLGFAEAEPSLPCRVYCTAETYDGPEGFLEK